MSRLIRFIYSRLAPGLLVLALAGCVPGGASVPATPTIIRLPEETRAAVETAQAQRRFAQSSPSLPTSTATAASASTPTAEPSPTATAALAEAEATPTPTPEVTASSAVAEASPEPDTAEHVVRAGESLTAIARRYGVTVQDLAAANGITNPSAIYVGQVLTIPTSESAASTPVATVPAATQTPEATADPTEHVVRPGESLTAIARRYGVTVQAIAEANDIANPSAIYAGQTLLIPMRPTGTSVPAEGTATQTPTATPRPVTQRSADPTGGRIAFQVASGGEIWAVNADGSGLERLTTGLDPAWSPDGRRLAFVRWEEPRGLYVLETATGEERLLRGLNLIKSPTWAPEGDRLAFAWETSGAEPTRLCFPGFGCFELPGRVVWSLTVVDTEGNAVADPAADQRSFSPSWSPSGDWIAYQGENGLKATTPDGQPWVVLDDVAAVFPEVAPNGQQLVFMYRQHDHWEVYTSLFDGTGIRALTQSSPLEEQPAQNVAPTWSPDGSQILFLSDRDGRWRPYIMQADGSDQRPFLPEVFDQFTFRYDFAAERVFSWR